MVLKLNQIFDSFTNKTIFKNKFVLQSNYTPETIPHRDNEIKQIAAILAPALRLERPSNLFLYGKTGTGKTLSVQYVKNELLKKAHRLNVPVTIEYINCKLKKVADTEYRILVEVLRKLGEKVPATGLPTDQVYQRFVGLIDKKKQLLVLILDEVDQAVKRMGDSFLYNLTRLNSELSKAQLSIIGISNDLVFADSLDPRVKSSLSEEELVFPPYNAVQLQDILKERAKQAFKKGTIGQGVIAKSAAYAAREHGDARRALDLLRIAGEITEREVKKRVGFEHIDKANAKIEKDKILDVIETQPKQFKLTLLAIIQLIEKSSRKGGKKREEAKIFTGDIYNIYNKLCKQTRTECLTQRRVGDIIAEFDMLGLINAKVISKGRYGRTREIRLAIPQQLIMKIKQILEGGL